MMGFGEFAATTQFFLYGKQHFTRTGWESHKAKYEKPDILDEVSLEGRIFMVTGANSGIGKEIAKFLVKRGASVYMVCRSKDRAEAARQEILENAGNGSSDRVVVLLADCSLEADVRRCWAEFAGLSGSPVPRLDGLVCNAGALADKLTLTAEGVEVTFAAHLLFGTYLLGSLAMASLQAANGRLVVVSSGGMYNTAFPDWATATSTGGAKFDGQFAYAYAKRAQVLLCERWAAAHPEVAAVSCHPGWTDTPGVDDAYGSKKSYLEPLRDTWQGSEGIIWLCVAPREKLVSGAFYLDREPQVKHMAGPFFTEGSATKNSEQEVGMMMRLLDAWSSGRRVTTAPASQPLQAMTRSIDLASFMGRWYVIFNIPTYFDKGSMNNVEDYTLDPSGVVYVNFSYQKDASTAPSVLQQRASVANESCTEWRISPKVGFFLPLNLAYLILDCANDYSTCIIGVPDRQYVWAMARTPTVEAAVMSDMIDKIQVFGYNVSQLIEVPQVWPSA